MVQCRVIFTLMAKKTDYRTNPYVEIQIKEFYYPTKEDALKAAKMATRGKSDTYLGAIEDDKSKPGFNIYWNGKVIEKHLVEYKNFFTQVISESGDCL